MFTFAFVYSYEHVYYHTERGLQKQCIYENIPSHLMLHNCGKNSNNIFYPIFQCIREEQKFPFGK